MKFKLDRNNYFENCIKYINGNCIITLSRFNSSYIQLSITAIKNTFTDVYHKHNFDKTKDVFCKKYNIKVIEKSWQSNQFWDFYKVKCDFSKFERTIKMVYNKVQFEYLKEKTQHISKKDLLKLYKNRKGK